MRWSYSAGVFPVPTGMNRRPGRKRCRSRRVPRAHGDEPAAPLSWLWLSAVFPVPTGMNRWFSMW